MFDRPSPLSSVRHLPLHVHTPESAQQNVIFFGGCVRVRACVLACACTGGRVASARARAALGSSLVGAVLSDPA